MPVDRVGFDLEDAADKLGGTAITAVADVSKTEDTQSYVNQAADAWGGIEVRFAGVSGTAAPAIEYPEDIFDEVIAVNVRGSFLACKYAIPHMGSGGTIIVTSGIMGATGRPNSLAYITSKHVLVGLVRCISKEVAGSNIRANILAPGPISNAFQQAIEDRASALAGVDMNEMLNKTIPLGRHAELE